MAMGWSTAGPELRLEIARLTSHAIDVIYDVAWPLFWSAHLTVPTRQPSCYLHILIWASDGPEPLFWRHRKLAEHLPVLKVNADVICQTRSQDKWEQTRPYWPTPRILVVPLYCCRHQVIYGFALAVTPPGLKKSSWFYYCRIRPLGP